MWTEIKGYEGLYEVNEIGKVRNAKKLSEISARKSNNGYMKVHLYKNNICANKYVHRLVAETFITNTENLPCVNHIDGNKLNNSVSNLEWCTYSKNSYHAYKIGLKKVTPKTQRAMITNGKKRKKAVIQYDLEGNFIKEWESISQIHDALMYSCSNISRCCRGVQLYANNYKWCFKEIIL